MELRQPPVRRALCSIWDGSEGSVSVTRDCRYLEQYRTASRYHATVNGKAGRERSGMCPLCPFPSCFAHLSPCQDSFPRKKYLRYISFTHSSWVGFYLQRQISQLRAYNGHVMKCIIKNEKRKVFFCLYLENIPQ